MGKRLIVFSWIVMLLAAWGQGLTLAGSEEKIFLLGQNKEAEVVDAAGNVLETLALDEAPRAVITNRQGAKLFLCGGKSRWSLALLSPGPDGRGYQRIMKLSGHLNAWLVDREQRHLWAVTEGQNAGNPAELVKVDLENLQYRRVELDSPARCLALSPAEDRVIVATAGKDPDFSNLVFWNPDTLQPWQTATIAKNPAALYFSQDCRTLLAVSYGYNRCFKIPAGDRLGGMQGKTTLPAGISYIDLATGRVRDAINLGNLSSAYVHEAGRLYALTVEREQGRVVALDDSGIAAIYPVDFIPRQIALDSTNETLYITGRKELAVFKSGTAQRLAQLKLDRPIGQLVLLAESHDALIYQPAGRGVLSRLNGSDYRIENRLQLGRGYVAAWKTLSYGWGADIAIRQGGMALLGTLLATPDMLTRRGDLLMVASKQKAYIYNRFTQDITIVDLQKRQILRRIGCTSAGRDCLLYAIPDSKYVIVSGSRQWRLINTESDQVDLTLRLNWLGLAKPAAPRFYPAPSGDRLIAAGPGKIYFIDPETGRVTGRVATATRAAVIGW